MRAVVIYESMYGNTHTIAEAIGRGLAMGNEVTVVPVAEATPELLKGGGSGGRGRPDARARDERATIPSGCGGGRG
jgi:hypothetical protein